MLMEMMEITQLESEIRNGVMADEGLEQEGETAP
jgi:hypothetical protein